MSISRAERRDEDEFDLYPIRIEARLPRIGIPLAEGDPDVVVDLQSLADRGYDRGQYARWIDYGKDAVPPLAAEAAAWADDLLRRAGRRGPPPA